MFSQSKALQINKNKTDFDLKDSEEILAEFILNTERNLEHTEIEQKRLQDKESESDKQINKDYFKEKLS